MGGGGGVYIVLGHQFVCFLELFAECSGPIIVRHLKLVQILG